VRFSAALAALVECGVAQWFIRHDPSRVEASVGLIAGAVLAGWLLGRPHVNTEAPRVPVANGTLYWVGMLLSAAGVGAYVWAIHLLTTQWHYNFDFAVPLAIAAIGVWSIGLGLLFRTDSSTPWTRWEAALFVIFLLIGLFARFYRYDYYPPEGVCAVEEPQSGQLTHLILHSHARPWEFVGDRWLGVPFFYYFGETLWSLRIPYTIVSWLTLIPFYLLVRLLVSRPAALFSLALFALSSWHLMYARLAHNIFPTTLIAVLVMYLCMQAHRSRGLGTYPWIGFLCAYTLYTYAGYRGTPVFAALFLGLSFLIHVRDWRRAQNPEQAAGARRILRLQIAGFLVAIAAFIGPIIALQPRLAGENRGHFFEAANRSIINSEYYSSDVDLFLPRLRDRVIMTARLFNHLGDGSETFNLPGEPMLDPVTGTLFAVALAYCVLWGVSRWQGYFAFVFLALLIFGAVVVGNFDPRRLQGIIPPIFVLIAFTADRFAQATRARLGRAAPIALLALTAAVTGYTYYLNWDLFFVRTINDPRVRMAFQNRYTVAVRYLKSLPDGAYMLFVSDVPYFFRPSDLEFMRGHRIPGMVTADLMPLFHGEHGPWSDHDLYVLMQEPFEHEAIGKLLQARFPGAECIDATHPDRPAQSMTGCKIPHPEQGSLVGGIRARYFRADAAEPFVDRLEPAITYAFLPKPCGFPDILGKPPCRAVWDGSLEVAQNGTYFFQAESRNGKTQITIDGELLQPSMNLSAGAHRVHGEASYTSAQDEAQDGGTRLLWRRSSNDPWQLVPFGTMSDKSDRSDVRS